MAFHSSQSCPAIITVGRKQHIPVQVMCMDLANTIAHTYFHSSNFAVSWATLHCFIHLQWTAQLKLLNADMQTERKKKLITHHVIMCVERAEEQKTSSYHTL